MTTDKPDFGAVVRAEMERQGMSKRALAKRIAALDDGGKAEQFRRSLYRWLSDDPATRQEPSDENKLKVAKVLGIDPAVLFPPSLEDVLVSVCELLAATGKQDVLENVARRLEIVA